MVLRLQDGPETRDGQGGNQCRRPFQRLHPYHQGPEVPPELNKSMPPCRMTNLGPLKACFFLGSEYCIALPTIEAH